MVVRLEQRERLTIALALGLVAGGGVSFVGPWILAALAGWAVAASFILGTVWSFVARFDAAATRAVATREDDSRAAVDVIVVTACVTSLAGVIIGLARAKESSHGLSIVLTTVAVVTVLLSWGTVHTMFVLRYAHLFYSNPATPAVDFPNDGSAPDYLDFVYLAFTVGMTFQVSDTTVANRQMRHAVIRHALLSYLFGTVIVGITINVLGGLV